MQTLLHTHTAIHLDDRARNIRALESEKTDQVCNLFRFSRTSHGDSLDLTVKSFFRDKENRGHVGLEKARDNHVNGNILFCNFFRQ